VKEIELDGDVRSLGGACPTVQFEVEGRTVFTTASTKYKDGDCRRLRNRREVEVKGWLLSDGKVRADRIEFDDDDDDDDDDDGDDIGGGVD
jgi:hypothetical protein